MSFPGSGHRYRLVIHGPLAVVVLPVMLAGGFIPRLVGIIVLIRCLVG